MSSLSLFSSEENESPLILALPDSEILYYPNFLQDTYASEVFKTLLNETKWQQDDIKIYGKVYKQPRLTALYGEKEKSYSYSNITMYPIPFTPLLQEIKTKVEATAKTTFTTVLLNLYRDGNDSNGWHSDNEKELGGNPVIASVSLGAKRCFKLKHRGDKKLNYKVFLDHGSLLLMQGKTQHYWLHELPKSKKTTNPRINLTFRILK
ncbi:MAG: alpha-ketoglutarate-dependent dioxygenase AlkB [Flavobacteriaceae bacterium]|nr:alpha-ketoglutarate-dependent dioxygenase AlkB [Flavobacteriaceae bacterium]